MANYTKHFIIKFSMYQIKFGFLFFWPNIRENWFNQILSRICVYTFMLTKGGLMVLHIHSESLQVDPINKMKREKSVAKPPTAKPMNQFGHMRYQSVT